MALSGRLSRESPGKVCVCVCVCSCSDILVCLFVCRTPVEPRPVCLFFSIVSRHTSKRTRGKCRNVSFDRVDSKHLKKGHKRQEKKLQPHSGCSSHRLYEFQQ